VDLREQEEGRVFVQNLIEKMSAKAAGTIEMANKEEFIEMQQKLLEARRAVAEVILKLKKTDNDIRRAQLTRKELAALSDETRLFQSSGKAFVLTTKEDTLKELEDSQKHNMAAQEKLSEQRKYLDKKVQEAEQAIRELMLHNS